MGSAYRGKLNGIGRGMLEMSTIIGTQKEEHFFFEHEGSRLFAVLHIPATPETARGGVLFCDPWSREKLYVTRTYANVARGICNEGFYVLRIDCRGTGDSEGNVEDVTLASQLSDTKKAIDILMEKGVTQIALLGLRIGGTLAALAADGDERIRYLILWEPVANPQEHFDRIYRNDVTAMAWIGSHTPNSANLRENFLENGFVDVRGFTLSREAFSQFLEADLKNIVGRFRGSILAINIAQDARNRRIAQTRLAEIFDVGDERLETRVVDEKVFWTHLSQEEQRTIPSQLFNGTRDWLVRMM